ncbi:ISNCY family transposase [Candidatus Bipolaricaulota bacterium]|nr:ISNCY family transposase [Candidatus Bipolaricaulota bacterium]
METLNRVLEGQLRVNEAAVVLGVSERHAWRILAAYRREGATAVAHGNRGRRPANATAEDVRRQVIELARTRYVGVNHTHLTELLAEREGLILGRSTVRNILMRAGMESPRRRRPPRHRVRRKRLPQEGMLVQIDGSDHDWLEDRGPRMTLLLAVDDATGTVPGALFRRQEDSHGYFCLLWAIIERKGIPLALYSDRHGVFWHMRRSRKLEEEESGSKRKPTQFGRAMQDLGVVQVFAWSPQVKGRVEQVAGTFQDRLVTELRLAGASTLEEANRVLWEYLPRYNERFGVPAAQDGSAYRPLPPGLELAEVLCFKHLRKVARDNTVKYNWQTLQLLPGGDRLSYAGIVVEVRERLDGQLSVVYQGRDIPTQEAPPRRSVLHDGNRNQEHHLSPEGARFTERVAALLPSAEDSGTPTVPKNRRPTPRMQAYWDAVQEAKSRGLSLRAIARELGISRITVTKYAKATNPPVYGGVYAQSDRDRRLTKSLVSSP